MERPIVNVIEFQSVESIKDVDGWEAEQILRKYGHEPQQFSTQEPTRQPQPGLTFEEMVAQQEREEREEKMRAQQRMYGPRPTTFDPNNGYNSEVKYTSDDDTGFGFRIEITSDMNLPKY